MKTIKISSTIVIMFIALGCIGPYLARDEVKLSRKEVKNRQSAHTCWGFPESYLLKSGIGRMSNKQFLLSPTMHVRMENRDKTPIDVLGQKGNRFEQREIANGCLTVMNDNGTIASTTYAELKGNDMHGPLVKDHVWKGFRAAAIKVGHTNDPFTHAFSMGYQYPSESTISYQSKGAIG